jgi:hypothetical protein
MHYSSIWRKSIVPRGGFREGAGRRPTDTKVVTIRLSDRAHKVYGKQKQKGKFLSELIMSYQSRLENILENHEKYHTLIELKENAAINAAKGAAIAPKYSDHQESAARIAAEKSPLLSPVLYLDYCAECRPDPYVGLTANIRDLECWKAQHEMSVEELSDSWVDRVDRDWDKVVRIYEGLEGFNRGGLC